MKNKSDRVDFLRNTKLQTVYKTTFNINKNSSRLKVKGETSTMITVNVGQSFSNYNNFRQSRPQNKKNYQGLRGYFTLITELIFQEDKTILNIYVPNNSVKMLEIELVES